MSQFVEKNRSLLTFCSIFVQAAGWLLVVLWAVLASSLVSMLMDSGNQIKPTSAIFRIVLDFFPCLVILGIGQFIAFVLDEKGKMSFLLLNINIILFLYAAILTVSMVWGQWAIYKAFWPLSTSTPWAEFLLVTLKAMLPQLVAIILLIGAGLLARQTVAEIKKAKAATKIIAQPEQQ